MTAEKLSQFSYLAPALLQFTLSQTFAAAAATAVVQCKSAEWTLKCVKHAAAVLDAGLDGQHTTQGAWRMPQAAAEPALQLLGQLLPQLLHCSSGSMGVAGSSSSLLAASSSTLPEAFAPLGACAMTLADLTLPAAGSRPQTHVTAAAAAGTGQQHAITSGSTSGSSSGASEVCPAAAAPVLPDLSAWTTQAGQMFGVAEACVRALAAFGSDAMPGDGVRLLSLVSGLHQPCGSAGSLIDAVFCSSRSEADLGCLEQQQLHALLVSAVKYSARMQLQSSVFCVNLAGCAKGLTHVAAVELEAHLQAAAALGPVDHSKVLPWVWLVGRCLLRYFLHLLVPQQDRPAQHLLGDEAGTATKSLLGVGLVMTTTAAGHAMQQCINWLQAPGAAGYLAACGYQHLKLLEALEATADVLPADVLSMAGVPARMAGAVQVVQGLDAAGRALTNLAHPWACHNPACLDVSRESELQLVGGKGCICAGCLTAHYCGQACQRQHWQQHKLVCKALAAAQKKQAASESAA